jgi:hypothetical protein
MGLAQQSNCPKLYFFYLVKAAISLVYAILVRFLVGTCLMRVIYDSTENVTKHAHNDDYDHDAVYKKQRPQAPCIV